MEDRRRTPCRGAMVKLLALTALVSLAPAPASLAQDSAHVSASRGRSRVEPLVRAADFAKPHEAVQVASDRRLNLFCIGEGGTTVLFDAGGSDWSSIWALVQPEVAKRTKACSYDRAGLGYSDPAKGFRSPVAIVADMHALIHRGGLGTPLVLVGHSLGGFNVKLYAALHPEDVAALVLVDPAEQLTPERTRAYIQRRLGKLIASRVELEDVDGVRGLMKHFQDCASETRRLGRLVPGSDVYRRCTDPVRPALGPEIAAERLRLQVTQAYQDAQASEVVNSVYGEPRFDAGYKRLFVRGMLGDRPMIVLSHGLHDVDDPLEVADFEAGLLLHRETAGLSRRGRQRTVPGTTHNI